MADSFINDIIFNIKTSGLGSLKELTESEEKVRLKQEAILETETKLNKSREELSKLTESLSRATQLAARAQEQFLASSNPKDARAYTTMISSRNNIYNDYKRTIKEVEANEKELIIATKESTKSYSDAVEYLKRADAAMKNNAKAVRGSIEGFKELTYTVAKLAATYYMIKQISGAFIGIFTSIAEAGMEMQKYGTILKTLEGPKKAAEDIAMLKKLALETPVSLSTLTESLVKLKAYGLAADKDMLMSYTDTAVAMGKETIDVVEAVADAVNGEFERLKEFNIKGSKLNGIVKFRFTGTDGKEWVASVEDDVQKIQKLLKEIQDFKFKGASADFKETLAGQIDAAKDQWKQFQDQLANSSGMMTGLTAGFKAISDYLQMIRSDSDSMQDISSSLSLVMSGLAKAASVVFNVFVGISSVVDTIFSSFKNFFNSLEQNFNFFLVQALKLKKAMSFSEESEKRYDAMIKAGETELNNINKSLEADRAAYRERINNYAKLINASNTLSDVFIKGIEKGEKAGKESYAKQKTAYDKYVEDIKKANKGLTEAQKKEILSFEDWKNKQLADKKALNPKDFIKTGTVESGDILKAQELAKQKEETLVKFYGTKMSAVIDNQNTRRKAAEYALTQTLLDIQNDFEKAKFSQAEINAKKTEYTKAYWTDFEIKEAARAKAEKDRLAKEEEDRIKQQEAEYKKILDSQLYYFRETNQNKLADEIELQALLSNLQKEGLLTNEQIEQIKNIKEQKNEAKEINDYLAKRLDLSKAVNDEAEVEAVQLAQLVLSLQEKGATEQEIAVATDEFVYQNKLKTEAKILRMQIANLEIIGDKIGAKYKKIDLERIQALQSQKETGVSTENIDRQKDDAKAAIAQEERIKGLEKEKKIYQMLHDDVNAFNKNQEIEKQKLLDEGINIAVIEKAQLEEKIKFEEEHNKKIEEKLRLQEDAAGGWARLRKQVEDANVSMADIMESAGKGFESMIDSLSGSFFQLASEGKLSFSSMKDAFKDFAKSALIDIGQMITKQMMLRAIMMATGGGVGGGIGGAIAGAFKDGGAFNNGVQVKAFADGGAFTNTIASAPTMAPMAVFGEAGPEAIMPLTRHSDGSLGVKAQVQTAGTNVIVNNYSSAKITSSTNEKGETTLTIKDVEAAVSRQLSSGKGLIADSLSSAYSVKRR